MSKILITGGGGFIGFHLAKSLLNDGHKVTILENFIRGRKDQDFTKLVEQKNVNLIEGDITNHNTFTNLDDEYKAVFHFAAINGTENFYKIPDKVLKVGILGTLNILDWFVKRGNGKLIFASSSEAYAGTLKIMGDDFPIPTPEDIPLTINNPANTRWSYGGSKILGELAFHAYSNAHGLSDWSIVRFHNIYGPRMGYEHVIPQMIDRVINREDPFVVFDSDATRSFCFIEDAVQALKLILKSKDTNRATLNIGRSDGEIKISELVEKIFSVANVSPQIINKAGPKGSVKRRCPNIDKLNQLGYKPQTDLEDGIDKTYNWYLKEVSH
tara:strand:+ start:1668 stop:2648 length:981 start_codon:yes stop_codon:yes gene_type:complete